MLRQQNVRRPFELSCLYSILLACCVSIAQADPVSGQGTWETTLQPRDIDGNGSVDAYYDTVLDITWLVDANYMATSNWDTSQSAGGWPEEQFVDYLAGFGHLGVLNWRLPSLSNSNQGATGGELAHLYLQTLGNVPGTGLVNTGPFANLQATDYLYDYPVSRGGLGGQIYAKSFSMVAGTLTGNPGLAWAVADGDVQQAGFTAPSYELVELGSLGGTSSNALDINNRAQIVGWATNANTRNRAFLYQNGVMQNLGTLMSDDSADSEARGINDLGEVTGSSTVLTSSGDKPLMGFHFNGSQMLPLGSVPADGYNYSFVRHGQDINDSGEIAIGLLDPSIHEGRFGLRTAMGQLTIEDSAGASYPLALNWLGTALGEIQNYGYGLLAQRLLSAGQFRVVANNTVNGNSFSTIRLKAISDKSVVAGNLVISSCGSNFCDPSVSHGIVADADDVPLTRSKVQEILGTRSINLINSNGEMVGQYANRWVVKPVGGPSLFLDSLVNLQGWDMAYLSVQAMNEYGDIVGSARKTGSSSSQAILLRRLNPLQSNLAPLAHVSAKPTVILGDTVELTGRIKDYEGDALTRNWALTQAPAGSAAVLNDAATLTPSFTADAAGTYTVTLVANDGTHDSNAATAQITARASNAKPQVSITSVSPKKVYTLVQLNGSASDADTDPVTVFWTLTQAPAGSQAAILNPSTLMPSIRPDVAGTYVVTLVANDGFVDSDPAQIQISVYPNTPPVAIATANPTVMVGNDVQLTGSATDADRDRVTLNWSLIQKPAGSVASIVTLPGGASARFRADQAGTYVATLIAFDGYDNSAPSQVQIVAFVNIPPVANAGANQVVVIGDNVQLNGSVSDAENNPTTVRWTLTQKPSGSTAVLSSTTALGSSFVADVAGTYIATLVANDGYINSAPSQVQIVATTNTAPVANAGANQAVFIGDNVQLSGSVSDAENHPTTVQWTLTQKPSGSSAVLTGDTTLTPTFNADIVGTYEATLVANDGNANSDPAIVRITVQPVGGVGGAAISNLQNAIALLDAIPPERLKNLTARRQLVAFINEAIKKINNGNYSAARAILSSDVLAKVDGCAVAGSPDKNDALLSCADQGAVYPLIVQAINQIMGAV